ncbi:ABC-2 family transporter protein [uncultured Rubinisphaera sp.]|uniref:ABC transporter permease n=1 Tax=uncultured Rubinisphaera sp. TaxID=1678686 RepID=UPI0030DD77B9|tara:strand:- start:414 stop:1256 length:843 start_codon:yes stop_codon:yes gene_type:complete
MSEGSPVEDVFKPNYLGVWTRCAKNSIVRELSFRSNFLITIITRGFWFAAQLILFEIIYQNVNTIADWNRAEYFGFMATGMLINAIIESLFMPNCANFSELIRTGNLDFVLLKPIDTQFLISIEKINLAMMNQILLSGALLAYSLANLDRTIGLVNVLMYLLLVAVGVIFFYCLMITLASTSVWFGRNQGLYDFWFYVTVFARYPQQIYTGGALAESIRVLFSFVLPILLVVTVPAQILVNKALEPSWIALWSVMMTAIFFVVSRRVFLWSIGKYRSASS